MTQIKVLSSHKTKAKKSSREGVRNKVDIIPNYFVHFERDNSELAKFFGSEPISMNDLQTKLWAHLSKHKLIVSE